MSMEIVTQESTVLTNSVKQAAIRTGLSERSIWSAIAQRKLRAVRVGGRVLVPEEALRLFVGLKEVDLPCNLK